MMKGAGNWAHVDSEVQQLFLLCERHTSVDDIISLWSPAAGSQQ